MAYHQLPLAEESRHMTAFVTHNGLYLSERVRFGLVRLQQLFQKMMTHVLQGFSGTLDYLDDILM